MITALIVLGREALMEILGLVPCQSQTQYLEERFRVTAEWQQRGNEVATCCCSVAAFIDPDPLRGNKPATCCHFKKPYVQWRRRLRCQVNPTNRA